MTIKHGVGGDYGLDSSSTEPTVGDLGERDGSEDVETLPTTPGSTPPPEPEKLRIEEEKYGSAKPRRVIIRAQVKHDRPA